MLPKSIVLFMPCNSKPSEKRVQKCFSFPAQGTSAGICLQHPDSTTFRYRPLTTFSGLFLLCIACLRFLCQPIVPPSFIWWQAEMTVEVLVHSVRNLRYVYRFCLSTRAVVKALCPFTSEPSRVSQERNCCAHHGDCPQCDSSSCSSPACNHTLINSRIPSLSLFFVSRQKNLQQRIKQFIVHPQVRTGTTGTLSSQEQCPFESYRLGTNVSLSGLRSSSLVPYHSSWADDHGCGTAGLNQMCWCCCLHSCRSSHWH